MNRLNPAASGNFQLVC